MTGENIGFVDPLVAKEAVGRLGVGPVLTCPRWLRLLYATTAPKVVAVACHAEHPQTRIPPLHCLSILPTGNPQTTPGIARLDPVAVSSWQSLRHASSSQGKYLA